MDEPDGEQTFRNYMIYGGIWLLEVDEQTCYPKDHIKREDNIPVFHINRWRNGGAITKKNRILDI